MAEAPQMQLPKVARPVHLFTVPSKLAAEVGVHEVGLITLSADEELQAYQRGKKDSAKIAAELAKAALVEVDGKPMTVNDGSADTLWRTIDPRVRQLVLTAYAEIHGAEEADQESFLKSRKVRAG